jgi:hypothetical protein
MAYKFQFGTTKLSGSTTFEESVIGESSISGSGRISGKELILDAAGVIGTSADTDLMTLTSNKVSVAGDLSASLAVSALDLLLDSSGKIGVQGDVDLIQLAANSFKVNGAVSGSGALSAAGAVSAGNGKFTVTNEGVVVAGATTVNGALSGSSTLQAAGIVTLGNGKTTVSVEGVLSSSATATLDEATFDRITAPTLLGNMSGSGALDLMGAASFGNARLVVNENLILGTADLHVSGNFFKERVLDSTDLAANASRVAYFDMKAGAMRTTDFSVYASILAGTGITATAGVLSVDTTGGDSMTATPLAIVAFNNDGATATSGLNFLTEITASGLVILPSGSTGDVVIIKGDLGVSSTNYIKISSSLANGNDIDGFSEARIESVYGAVSLIYNERAGQAHGDWSIY